ncbi:amidohydrolase family protein (plasmid) [Paraburkholderia sprentiae WSM5005]|uniref:Amidohydrolase family protein n=1 Tax=Paraburkholderia sprentiae WSM5005 TaxID=754502 RepID=A0A1I9YUZ8_9BURK|nr:amidohydrolase family protein [Paraburkholderia sprentiae]APA90036.1 amidohydrolase family protein [Paraburkholderia sprentiae WSM5005]
MDRILFKNGALLDPLQAALQPGHDLLVEGDTIKAVSQQPIDAHGARIIDLEGKTIMPGLIDLHAHMVATQFDLPSQVNMPNVFVTLKTLPIMRGMLRRGFTTVRDAGGAGFALKQAVEMGLAQGPRLFVAGRALSQTGGHGDGRARTDFLPGDAPCNCCVRVGALSRVVDGVDALRRAVREELQMGADQIKIMASGGVASPTDPIGALGYSEDEIRAVVAEAQARGTYVMAHAYTAESIQRAVRCGVRTIEHGNLIDEPTAALMAECGAYVVPTLVTYEALHIEGVRYGLSAESAAKIDIVRESGLKSLEIFRRAGVKMGFGTDLLGPGHRMQSDEFAIRAQVLTSAEIIGSATTIGAEILGMTGKLGRLAPGAYADVLVVDGDPLRDLSCLSGQGEHIPLVMKGGRVEFNELP